MQINYIHIKNYRGIKNAHFNLSPMGCLIGENNAGKSSILLAISLFFSGSRINLAEYYDTKEEISIEIHFGNISAGDINRLKEEHRERINEIITNGNLKLVRKYYSDGSGDFLCKRWIPQNHNLRKEIYTPLLTGKRGKEIEATLSSILPSLKEQFAKITTIKAAKETLETIATGLHVDDLIEDIASLPTGIDRSILALLPEPVLIPAVKDLTDETKTKEAATFGKLLSIMQKFIEGSKEIIAVEQSFDTLHGLLNIMSDTNGNPVDNRLPVVKDIEKLINSYTQENFPNSRIGIRIPKPELKQVLSNAQIEVNDGIVGTIDTKGDGLKRSITFALLRSYVEMYRLQKKATPQPEEDENINEVLPQPYLFLFEEPELYLHPNAQKVLFDALKKLADSGQQVLVSTHSPIFVSADSTGTFIKIIKDYPNNEKPYGKVIPIDFVTEIGYKDAFQVLCYENNSAAFFAKKVLLVEGDSDYIFLRKVAKFFNEQWDFDGKNIPIIRISGKGNVKKFKKFFEQFEIEVHTLLDLDALIDGFNLLGLDTYNEKRSALLNLIDQWGHKNQLTEDLTRKKIKDIVSKYSWGERYRRLKDLVTEQASKRILTPEEIGEINLLFSEETKNVRRQVLSEPMFDRTNLNELIVELWKEKTYILSKGAIENYYPENTTGPDKPTKALNAVLAVDDKYIENPNLIIEAFGQKQNEIHEVLKHVFAN